MTLATQPDEESVAPGRDRRRERVLLATMAVAIAGIAMVALTSVDTPIPFLGWYLLSSIAPAALIVAYRAGERAVVAVLLVAALSIGLGVAARASDDLDPFQQRHDGGVVATLAAAEMVSDLENPYTADFSDALAPDHDTLEAIGGDDITNPLVAHFPYLPAAFLVHVPFVLLGSVYDPRVLYVAVTLAALIHIARGAGPSWGRAAALWAIVGNGAVAVYLSWGANDAAAASLVVLAALQARRRPILAGVLLALGISLKALLVVAVVPLAVLWLGWSRRDGIRSLSSAVVVLAATCGPYLLANPAAFWEDVVSFNLGSTELDYPTSGIGLGAIHPDVIEGPLLLGLSAALVLGVAVGVLAWLRRSFSVEVALFGAGLLVFAGLLPARSFQISYFPLLVLLWAPIWRLPLGSVVPLWRSSGATSTP